VTSLEQSVKRITLDNEARRFEVEMTDGSVHQQEDAFPAEDSTLALPRDFRQVTFDTGARTLTLTPPDGAPLLVVEVHDNDDQMVRRSGRPVVYLDQNQWIQLGRALNSPQTVSAPELSAAKELLELAQRQRVILPVSSGHMVETTQTDRAWRKQLGPLMVELSRGWLMRDPLRVRRAELIWMFSRRTGGPEISVGDVITLDPAELTADDLASRGSDPELLPAFQRLSNTMSAITSIFAVLIEDERLHSELARELAARWATAHYDLAQHLKSSGMAKTHYRKATLRMFLSDLLLDVAHAVLANRRGLESLEAWVSDLADDDLAQLPYLGRSRDVIHLRLCNPDDRWKPNDLIDMLFLPCAAAYADFVVGEKKTIDYLVRAERTRSGGAVLVSSLAGLVDRLEPVTCAAS
jgi:hypothetical protein